MTALPVSVGQVYWSDTYCMRAVVYGVYGDLVKAVTIHLFGSLDPRYVTWANGVPAHYKLERDPVRRRGKKWT